MSYSSSLSPQAIVDLFRQGYVVLDNAFDPSESGKLELAVRILDECGMLSESDAATGRDDSIHFVHERSAMLPVAAAIQRLKGYAETLQVPYAIARAEGGASPWAAPWTRTRESGFAEQLEARLPATKSRMLTSTPLAQIASYAVAGTYCVHSDNSRSENGQRRNNRILTAVAYATPPDWSEKDGGNLRIWTGTDEIDCNVDDPEELINQLRLAGSPHIDIAPLSGRVVIFRSTLLHELRASWLRPRRAVTQWFCAPYTLTSCIAPLQGETRVRSK